MSSLNEVIDRLPQDRRERVMECAQQIRLEGSNARDAQALPEHLSAGTDVNYGDATACDL